jgi:CheY-like chemotaxis protein/two-component sensor histidine kinase
MAEQTVGDLNDKQAKYISIISESGQHLLELINDILDLAKIEAGQVTLSQDKVNIEAVCQASLRMVKQLALKKKQEVETEIDPNLGTVWADERRLKQMLVNLLSNAVKFTPENGTLGLQVRGNRKNNTIQFTIWDRGIGIGEKDLPRLFQPFVQLDSNLARKSGGTGLGLALVAKMASLHGGSVSVESQPGEGSRFTLTLPWESVHKTGSLSRQSLPTDDPSAPARERHTLLLVEDTDEVVLLFKDYLEHAGYRVVTARNGMEGVALAEKISPSLILMDVQMPVMDGLEATRRIRKIPNLERTPIIAITAFAMKGDRERCLEAGMNDYLSKPIMLKTLIEMIKDHLSSAPKDPTI